MKTNYRKALDLLEESRGYVDGAAAALMIAQAQVYAILAQVDAARGE